MLAGLQAQPASISEQPLLAGMQAHATKLTKSAVDCLNAYEPLARMLKRLGRYEGELGIHQKSVYSFMQALTMYQQLYGDKPHRDIAHSLNNVGNSYEALGKIRTGLNYQQQALAMSQQLHGDEPHPNVASSLNNVGVSYKALGEIHKGLEYQ